jgi:serine/threonine protein kinase
MKNNKSGLLYAVKKIKKSCKIVEEFESINWERDIVKFLINYKCKNVVNFYRIIETIEHIYFIQEYIEPGSLGQFIRKSKTCLPSVLVKDISIKIIEGLYEIHKYGILHRDLKLENILVDDNDTNDLKIKLIDFGLSKVILKNKNTSESYGTFLYSAPEVLLSIPYNLNIDLWSLGIIIFYLQYTYLPFNINGKEHEQEIASKIVMNELIFPQKLISDSDYNEEMSNILLQKIIEKCLVKNSKKRANIYKLKDLIRREEKNLI